jgi:hypothetical protein
MKEERTKRPGGERALLLAAAVFFLILCAACLPLIRWMFQPEFGPWLQGKVEAMGMWGVLALLGVQICLLYTSPSPRDTRISRMPSSA